MARTKLIEKLSVSGSRLFDEKSALLFLAVYRGLVLVVAISLVFGIRMSVMPFPRLVLISCTIAYSIFKVLHPSSHYHRLLFEWIDLAVDCALAASLLLFTGGLHSPFLLYCLTPVLTYSLLFPRRFAMLFALIPILSSIGGQIISDIATNTPLFYPAKTSISLSVTYSISSLLFAFLPYTININLTKDIKTQAIVDERKRLSRDIHDRVAQTMGVVRWRLQLLLRKINSGSISQVLNDIAEIDKMLAEAQQETRTVIDQLRNPLFESQGFVASLSQYATDFTHNYGIKCELHIADGEINLPGLTELELLCVAQEALNNVRKHSEATRVEIGFVSSKLAGAELTIRDNGRGFNTEKASSGYGLTVMEERVKSVGGELLIKSGLGQGTEIKVKLTHGL